MNYYRYNDSFEYIGITETEPTDSLWTTIGYEGCLVKPIWNGAQWEDGATQEELKEFKKSQTPQEVQLWRIRTIIKLLQLETQIEIAIDTLPEPSKTAATYIWKFGTTVERASQTILLLQAALQLTDEQVDDLFIQAEQIVL